MKDTKIKCGIPGKSDDKIIHPMTDNALSYLLEKLKIGLEPLMNRLMGPVKQPVYAIVRKGNLSPEYYAVNGVNSTNTPILIPSFGGNKITR